MNRILSICLFVLATLTLRAQSGHDWNVNPNAFSSNMTGTFQVRIDGVVQTSTALELGAFVGNQCRAKETLEPVPAPLPSISVASLTINGEAGDMLSFYLFDHTLEEELEVLCATVIAWEDNANIGSVIDPIVLDFITPIASCYMVITDPCQLVAGRRYLVASGSADSKQALGCQNADDRQAVDITMTGNKTTLMKANSSLDKESVYEIVLDGTAEAWTLNDAVNEGGLTTSKYGLLRVSPTNPTSWTIDVKPDGTATIMTTVDGSTLYMACKDDAFCCKEQESTVTLLAVCELISGELSNLRVADATKMFVVGAGNTLSVTGELSTINNSNLVLEPNTQLLNQSEGVHAMMQYEVTAYDDAESSTGFMVLSSPMAAATVASASSLTWSDYDLYRYDEEQENLYQEWSNYKDEIFNTLEPGRGYLYANANDCRPACKGTINVGEVRVQMNCIDSQKGFNLIGNPFTHNIYKGVGGAIDDTRLEPGYYVLNASGEWEAREDSEPIKPGQAILVKATEAFELVIENVY